MSQHRVSSCSPGSIPGEKSAIDLVLSKTTPELRIHAHCRNSGEVFSMNLKIQLESSIPFHPSKQSLCQEKRNEIISTATVSSSLFSGRLPALPQNKQSPATLQLLSLYNPKKPATVKLNSNSFRVTRLALFNYR